MSEPSLALQRAIYAALMATPAVVALIGQRSIYDRVARNPDGTADQQVTFPYIRIGDDQVIDAGTDCDAEACEVYATIHVFSRAVGKVECKTIAGAIRRALTGTVLDLTPDGYAPSPVLHHDSRYLDDPDGLTTHGVVTFRALIDTAA